MEQTLIIRQKGQITLPKKIRNKLIWTEKNSVINIILKNEDELILTPFSSETGSNKKWKNIWNILNSIRKIGKKVNLSDFIINDRQNH